MKYIPSAILAFEGGLSLYMYFFPRSFFNSSPVYLILGIVFAALSYFLYKKPRLGILRWIAVLVSLFFGPGGFIGFGGLFGVGLAVSFFIADRKKASLPDAENNTDSQNPKL